MAGQKIRIKLSAYDHELVDEAASRIVETMQKGGAKISGPIPLPTEREVVTILRCRTSIRTAASSSNFARTRESSTSILPTRSFWIASTFPQASTSK